MSWTVGNATPQQQDAGAGSWRLAPGHREMTQGVVVSPFSHLPDCDALLLRLPDGSGGAWLKALREVCAITPATGRQPSAAALAFTWSGLAAMGLDPAALASFSQPFREGMHQPDRQRRLSDSEALGTVLAGGPVWSANVPGGAAENGQAGVYPTAVTVHAVLLLYAADAAALDTLATKVVQTLEGVSVGVARRLRLSLRLDDTNVAREHFGFADGISQPVPEGAAIVSKNGDPLPHDPVHGIAAGDILMGHANAQGQLAPGPVVAAAFDPANLLPEQGAPSGFRNLGLDGSYLVVRELRQDVAAFWNSMYQASAATIAARTGVADNAEPGPDQAIAFASRVVGRTMDGDLLTQAGSLAPTADGPQNDFLFFASDPHGLGCPMGAHVRRANPRDGLAPDAQAAPTLLQAAQNHRLLRRGRKFGPTIEDPRRSDGVERGLLFMCLNTDLARQFEFVQQTWLLNPNFATLMSETDPLLGPRGRFTIPAEPLRLRPTVATYIQLAGGDYFFLPGIPALDYLQSLAGGEASAAATQ